jgi:phage tail sheath gpL-like
MAGYTMTGMDPNDPTPGNYVEIRWAQGSGTGGSDSRPVLFLANKTSAGTETVDTLGDPIVDSADCILRYGRRSEVYQMFRKYIAIDPNASISAIAVAEGGGAAAASRTFTFATTATATTTRVFECVDETFEMTITLGDTAIVQAANAAAKFAEQLDWPVTAAIGGGGSEHILTVTAANLGPRGDYILGRVRTFERAVSGTTVTAGAVSAGTTDDDQTNALALLAKRKFYYQVNPKSQTTGATATDNGLGEHAAFITSQALPSIGIRQQMIFGMVNTQGNSTTLANSINNPRCFGIWSENCKLPPCMLAAMFAAVKRLKEIGHPAANLKGYGKESTDLFNVSAPLSSGDWPTPTEVRACLNNGVTPVDFTPTGKSYIVRHVTTRSLNGSASDYRTRSGHIPSALDYAIDLIADDVNSVAQQWVTDDPPEGVAPFEGTTTPSIVVATIRQAISDKLIRFPGGPVLDPSYEAQMLAEANTLRLTNGTSSRIRLEAVKPNDKTTILGLQTDTGY